MLVQHAEIHVQVRRRRVRAECVCGHLDAGLGADVARQRGCERRIGGRDRGGEAFREFGQRPQLVAQALRHVLRIGLRLLLQQPRHQPFAARRRHLV
jgi:hypothetical protein